MNLKLVVALSLLAATPAFAQMQKQGAAPSGPPPTKADAVKVVNAISTDKAKMQSFCDLAKINDQMEQASEKNDNKTLETLGPKSDELSQKLGPDYVKLMDGVSQLDENSPVVKDVYSTFDALAKQCK